MECPKCKATNPEGKKYCGDCGACLDLEVSTFLNQVESYILQQIQVAVRDQLKDQKVVEIEIAQAIAIRLSEWTKLFGFFVGIPLTIFALLLGFLGIRTFADFSHLVEKAQKDATQKLSQAQQEAQAIKTQSDNLKTEYQRLKTQLGEVSALSQEVKTLSTTVKQIADRINFKPSKSLTGELQSRLKRSLASYQEYLQKLGYRSKGGEVDVSIDPNLKDNAYYDGSRNLIVIGEPFAKDTSVVLREFTHYVLTPKKMAGNYPIESGLADYFPCSFANNPLMGEKIAPFLHKLYGKAFDKPYIRNLENIRNFREVSPGSYPQDVGEIWGGAFWELRKLLGQEAADKLLFSTWVATGEISDSSNLEANFLNQLLEKAQSLEGGKYVGQIRSVFERRGAKF
jgi:hypothetical protein